MDTLQTYRLPTNDNSENHAPKGEHDVDAPSSFDPKVIKPPREDLEQDASMSRKWLPRVLPYPPCPTAKSRAFAWVLPCTRPA